MEKTIHPHWWKELKASGMVSMGSHMIREVLCDLEALQWLHCQVAAFRLPLAQHEASGLWNTSPQFIRLHPTDIMLHSVASGPRDFWAMRQEKTLALA